MTIKGVATNTDGNDGGNEVKLRAAKTRRGADASSRTGRAAGRMQRCSATTGWKVSSEITCSTEDTHQYKTLDCCVANLTTVFGLHNHFAMKSQTSTVFNSQMCNWGLTDSLQCLYYSISTQQKLIIVSTPSYA